MSGRGKQHRLYRDICVASSGYMCGIDCSQQPPRILAHDALRLPQLRMSEYVEYFESTFSGAVGAINIRYIYDI